MNPLYPGEFERDRLPSASNSRELLDVKEINKGSYSRLELIFRMSCWIQIEQYFTQNDLTHLLRASRKIFNKTCAKFLDKLDASYPILNGLYSNIQKKSSKESLIVTRWRSLAEGLRQDREKMREIGSHRKIDLSQLPPIYTSATRAGSAQMFFASTLRDLHWTAYVGNVLVRRSPPLCCDDLLCRTKMLFETNRVSLANTLERIDNIVALHREAMDALRKACANKDCQHIKFLIDGIRIDVNSPPCTELFLKICANRDPFLIDLFIQKGISLMHIDIFSLDTIHLIQLLDLGIDIDSAVIQRLCGQRYDLAVILYLYGYLDDTITANISDNFGTFMNFNNLKQIRRDATTTLQLSLERISRPQRISLCRLCISSITNASLDEFCKQLRTHNITINTHRHRRLQRERERERERIQGHNYRGALA
ncbi:MAG: hypothetical protein WCF19_05070 [Chlamydiales bacterium]